MKGVGERNRAEGENWFAMHCKNGVSLLVQPRASNDNEKADEMSVCIPTLERGNEGKIR